MAWMTTISDDFMREMLTKSKSYSVVILKPGPRHDAPEARQVVWEHGRKNFALRADGKLAIVCPVTEGAGVNGIGIFNATLDETRQIMDADPGVQAGLFVYEVFGCRSFPGDKLP
jgi:hypothetical protein